MLGVKKCDLFLFGRHVRVGKKNELFTEQLL